MAEFVQKEKFSGVWNGESVQFNRQWRGHRFTDEECEALCRGETVEIKDLVSQKTGNSYNGLAQLKNLEYNGHPYVGADLIGFGKKGIPNEFAGHTFTEDEKILLEAGKFVKADDFVSKKTGKSYTCKVRYDAEKDIIVREFNN